MGRRGDLRFFLSRCLVPPELRQIDPLASRGQSTGLPSCGTRGRFQVPNLGPLTLTNPLKAASVLGSSPDRHTPRSLRSSRDGLNDAAGLIVVWFSDFRVSRFGRTDTHLVDRRDRSSEATARHRGEYRSFIGRPINRRCAVGSHSRPSHYSSHPTYSMNKTSDLI
jgi:hypothetical protein